MRACLILCLTLLTPFFLGAGDQAPDNDLKAPMQQAAQKGVSYLKSAQKEGNWEHEAAGLAVQYQGGTSCLAVLALLESGVKADDPIVERGLDYVRRLQPNKTYIVALQTAVLARAGQAKDKPLLDKNAAWLIQKAATLNGKINGWSYPSAQAPADNSNTHYAVLGLHAATKAGVKVEADVWQQIGEYYLRDQLRTGGWSYRGREPTGERSSMISAGVTGLSLAQQHAQEFKAEKAIDQGWSRLADRYSPGTRKQVYFRFYDMHALRRAGEVTGRATLEQKQGVQLDWYREGVRELLKSQDQAGCWQGKDSYDGNPVLATSFALLYLADGAKLLK